MEAVGLAAGVVSLGLDLSTRLHTYVEGVKGFADRLAAVAAAVSATASIVRQLADLLGLFTAQGVADIEAVLRRCRHAYGVIVDILLGVSTGASTRTHAVLTAAGLSELSAARLSRLSSRARWPWLEPRLKACLLELETIKMDLLLSLHVAALAKHRMAEKGVGVGASVTNADDETQKEASAENEKEDDSMAEMDDDNEDDKGDAHNEIDEGEAILAMAKKLMVKRARLRRGSFSESESSDTSVDDPEDPEKSGDESEEERPRSFNMSTRASSTRSGRGRARSVAEATTNALPQIPPSQRDPELPSRALGPGQAMSFGSLGDAGTEMEAWLIGSEVSGRFFTVPVRGPSVEDLIRSHKRLLETGEENSSTLMQYVSLRPKVREVVGDVMDKVDRRDSRVRTLVGLLEPRKHLDLAVGCEVIALISTGEEEQVVHLEDLDRRAWRVPFFALKSSLFSAKCEVEVERVLLRHCDGGSSSRRDCVNARGGCSIRFRLCIRSKDGQAEEFVSLCGLHNHLRPGMLIRMVQDEHHAWQPRRQCEGDSTRFAPPVPGGSPLILEDKGNGRYCSGRNDFVWNYKLERPARRRYPLDGSPYRELFGTGEESSESIGIEGLDSVEDLLTRWTGVGETAPGSIHEAA